MIPITLQISLPAELQLSPEELASITGRKTARTQIDWLRANGWQYTLDAGQGILVGKLYAHLRLAGLQPGTVTPSPAGAGEFNMGATR